VADRLADHIALLDRGKLVAEGTAEELKRLAPGGHISLKFADPADFESAAAILDAISRDDNQHALQVASDGGIRSIRSVLDRLESKSIEADSLTVHTPDLDDVFFALTGQTTTTEEVSS
jgi:ABC-2 type transport system ATP-binding protein